MIRTEMPWDLQVLRTIAERLQTLDAAVNRAYEQCNRAGASAEEQAKSRHALVELLGTVSSALDSAYQRRAAGRLTDEELRFWLPPVEAIRTLVRRALASLPTSWRNQLGHARTRIQDSSLAVSESIGAP